MDYMSDTPYHNLFNGVSLGMSIIVFVSWIKNIPKKKSPTSLTMLAAIVIWFFAVIVDENATISDIGPDNIIFGFFCIALYAIGDLFYLLSLYLCFIEVTGIKSLYFKRTFLTFVTLALMLSIASWVIYCIGERTSDDDFAYFGHVLYIHSIGFFTFLDFVLSFLFIGSLVNDYVNIKYTGKPPPTKKQWVTEAFSSEVLTIIMNSSYIYLAFEGVLSISYILLERFALDRDMLDAFGNIIISFRQYLYLNFLRTVQDHSEIVEIQEEEEKQWAAQEKIEVVVVREPNPKEAGTSAPSVPTVIKTAIPAIPEEPEVGGPSKELKPNDDFRRNSSMVSASAFSVNHSSSGRGQVSKSFTAAQIQMLEAKKKQKNRK